MNRRDLLRCAAWTSSVWLGARPALALAAERPSVTVMLVPFSAGSDTDAVARLAGEGMSAGLPQPVVVENRTGAGGQIAMQAVAAGPADGSRIILTVQGATTVLPHLKIDPPYDPTRDFTPIARVASTSNALLVRADSAFRNLDDLMAFARRNPGKLNYASWGMGSGGHIAGEMLKAEAGIQTTHVAYRGTAEVVQALMAGEVDYGFTGYGLANVQSRGGRLKALAVLASKRSPAMPDVPTLQESGYDFVQDAWFGVLAPPGLSAQRRAALQAAVLAAVRAPAFAERLAPLAITPDGLDSERFAELIRSDHQYWGRVIEQIGIAKT